MTGHIELGATSSTRKQYLLVEPTQRLRQQVNPMSVKQGVGAGAYDDFQGFTYWLSDDWRQGVGRIDPSAGGYWFSTLDTRYESIAFLPPLLFPSCTIDQEDAASSWNSFGSVQRGVTIGSGQTSTKVIVPFKGSGTLRYVWFWLGGGDNASSATVTLYSGANTSSLSSIASASATARTTTQGASWRRFDLSAQTLTGGTQYWLEVEPTNAADTITVYANTSTDYGGGAPQGYNGSSYSAWTDAGTVQQYPFFLTDVETMGNITAAAYFNGTMYCGDAAGDLWKFAKGASPKEDKWTLVSSIGTGITDMANWYGVLYIALGDGTTARQCTTSDVVSAVSPAWEADLISYMIAGYFWRAEGNTVSYTSNSTPGGNWTDITVSGSDYNIIGWADLGNNVYVSTQWGLLAVTSGDAVELVTRWPYESDSNGDGMTENLGTIYVPLDNAVIQVQENVPSTNIWSRETRLPSGVQGKIRSVAGTNREVLALVNSTDTSGIDTIWSWNRSGWNFVAQLPEGMTGSLLYYDDSIDRFWCFTEDGFAFWGYPSTVTADPPTDPSSTFMPVGWLDTNIYYGNLKAVPKDIEGIQVVGRNIDDDTPVRIYYQDDDSQGTEDLLDQAGEQILDESGASIQSGASSWTLVGIFDENDKFIRFSDPDTRPNTRGLRLGILMETTSSSSTPVIDAVVVKYRAVVTDRYRWMLPISAADYQEMLDGSLDTRTAVNIMDEIDDYATGVPPISFKDVTGTVYNVYVVGLSERVVKLEYYDSGIKYHHVIDLVVEEVDGALSV